MFFLRERRFQNRKIVEFRNFSANKEPNLNSEADVCPVSPRPPSLLQGDADSRPLVSLLTGITKVGGWLPS